MENKEPEGRNIVICLDGTGNEIGSNLSNVLKLYRMTVRDEKQIVYYDPGVGTVGKPGWWSGAKQKAEEVFGLALGLGLDDNVLDAYSWLCRNWQEGDRIFLFGFSRGAYTARVLAGFIHMCGLLWPEQLNLCGYALVAYKRAADEDKLEIGFNFRSIADSRRVTIHFIGAWDTVASVIVPRPDRFYLPQLQTLPFTRRNPGVKIFRHAISIDERRRMFRLNHWQDPQKHVPDPWDRDRIEKQDIRQVWFAGVHADVGGGYPEPESGLSKYPLLWMIGEARAAGLRVEERLIDVLAHGSEPSRGNKRSYKYVEPDAEAEMHRSLAGPWWLLEGIPKYWTLQEWPRRLLIFDFYLPFAEPRPIPNRPDPSGAPLQPYFVHSSVLARMAACGDYRPPNLPEDPPVEYRAGPAGPIAPVPPRPWPRPGLGQRLWRAFTTMPDLVSSFIGAAIPFALLLLVLFLARLDIIDIRFVGWAAVPGLAAICLGRSLLEEALFRAMLVQAPPDGATGLGPILLSAVAFTLWHPLQKLLDFPLAPENACDAGFLLACFLLGAGCAWLFLRSRSIWPPILLHFGVALLGLALSGSS